MFIIVIVFWLGLFRPSGLLFSFVPALLLSILISLFLPSSYISLSYFILAVPMCECENTRAWDPHFLSPYWMVLSEKVEILFGAKKLTKLGTNYRELKLGKLCHFQSFRVLGDYCASGSSASMNHPEVSHLGVALQWITPKCRYCASGSSASMNHPEVSLLRIWE